MEESEVDTYKLNTEDTNQTLRISLINNEQISMILDNITNNQRYTTLVNLENLRKVCQVFSSTKNIQEALQILKNIIESGNIILTDDPQENKMEIRYNLVLENEEELPFDIELALEKQNNEEEEAEVLPPEFDYQGNKEAESKYGNTTSNTTEFVKPIVQSNVKPPILQLEYIEPILQVHYPDGTTKSTALPPRIQGANGETPNITEEQFKSIREQMNNGGAIRNFSPLRDFLNNNRSNSVVGKKNISMYSTQSTPYPAINNISTVNPFQNSVRTSFDQDESKYNYQTTINNNPNRYNNDFNKTAFGYSVMTMQARNYGNNDNFNNTNIYQKSNLNQHQNTNSNNVVERRPRMINYSKNMTIQEIILDPYQYLHIKMIINLIQVKNKIFINNQIQQAILFNQIIKIKLLMLIIKKNIHMIEIPKGLKIKFPKIEILKIVYLIFNVNNKDY